MDLFKAIIKVTIATYALLAWLVVAIPCVILIVSCIYSLIANFFETLSSFLPIQGIIWKNIIQKPN